MTLVVIGPSSSGKSTYISRTGLTDVVLGNRLLTEDVPSTGVIHYNSLRYSFVLYNKGELRRGSDIASEPIFRKMMESGRIARAVVIVAPVSELKARVTERTVAEPERHDTQSYDRNLWSDIVDGVDIYSTYEQVFDGLDAAGIPYDVVYSSSALADFVPSDRVYVHHNLRGRYVPPPPPEAIDAVISMNGSEYQATLLPGGRQTDRRVYEHVSSGRGGTFSIIRDRSLEGRSVLDIGCATGDMLFRAERHGATRLVGVEMMPKRHAAAVAIGNLLASGARILPCDFLEAALAEPFDDVLALNVLHHVGDFRGFLIKAARLARQRLIVEYPTLDDPRFRSLSEVGSLPSDLAIVGVSSSSVGQTFVFTRPAIERIVAETGEFTSRLFPSPIASREILVLQRVGAAD